MTPPMTPLIEIRSLDTGDYDAICEVWKASGVSYRTTGRESRESFARQMQSGIQAVFGAVDAQANRLVGVVVASHDGRKGWINRLGVRPDCQRQGVGTRLIQAADDWLHGQGMTITAALIVHGNDASLGLFQHSGYTLEHVYYLTKRDSPDA